MGALDEYLEYGRKLLARIREEKKQDASRVRNQTLIEMDRSCVKLGAKPGEGMLHKVRRK